jgi:hypothetical protein
MEGGKDADRPDGCREFNAQGDSLSYQIDHEFERTQGKGELTAGITQEKFPLAGQDYFAAAEIEVYSLSSQ